MQYTNLMFQGQPDVGGCQRQSLLPSDRQGEVYLRCLPRSQATDVVV